MTVSAGHGVSKSMPEEVSRGPRERAGKLPQSAVVGESAGETSRWATWRHIVQTCNPPGAKDADQATARVAAVDGVSRWLLITRACVFPMTINAGLIGGLLAATSGQFASAPFVLALVGIVLAHAANNMINDYFDMEVGVDSGEYPRAQYAPHPVIGGLISRRGLLQAIVAVNAADLAIAVYLTWLRGWPILAFAAAGLFISVFYVAPPIRLKQHGLGEPGVFAVWGPLMVGGVYYAATGTIPGWVWLASLPYALLVTNVLMGKHLDKLEQDRRNGIGTLPVLLGEQRARAVVKGIMVAFYASVLVIAWVWHPWVLLALLSVGRARRVWKAFTEPKPQERPEDWPIWPLWYAPWAFYVTRRAGEWFVLGLLAALLTRTLTGW